MSIRLSLLALLKEGPRHGYELRTEFEARTGGTWPLNVGQVYTTLARLERDGLVTALGNGVGETQVDYAITDAGGAAVASWFELPVERATPPRDELAIKLALAVSVPGVDVARVIAGQRTATLRAMQDYTRVKARAGEEDMAWLLVLESLIFQAEAEIRWLDHCDSRLAREARRVRPAADAAPAAEAKVAKAIEDGAKAADPGAKAMDGGAEAAHSLPTAPAAGVTSGGGR